jgi:hypothetical protein
MIKHPNVSAWWPDITEPSNYRTENFKISSTFYWVLWVDPNQFGCGFDWGLPGWRTSLCFRLFRPTTMGLPSISVSFKEYFSYVQTNHVGKLPSCWNNPTVGMFLSRSNKYLQLNSTPDPPYAWKLTFHSMSVRLILHYFMATIVSSEMNKIN